LRLLGSLLQASDYMRGFHRKPPNRFSSYGGFERMHVATITMAGMVDQRAIHFIHGAQGFHLIRRHRSEDSLQLPEKPPLPCASRFRG